MEKKNRSPVLIILACVFTLFSFSCTKDYREIIDEPEKKFYRGEYQAAAEMLKSEADKKNQNQLLMIMEAGMMFHAARDYETSNRVFLKAADLASLMPVSVSNQVASLLTNQTAENYRGEDFEKVLIHMYLGLNFMLLEKYEESTVEFRAVNQELMKIKTENGEARYKQNLMAKYLTALAFEIMGDINNSEDDWEFAYIEYRQIQELDPNMPLIGTDLLRMSKKLKYDDDYKKLKSAYKLSIPDTENTGELVLIYQSGKSPIKISRGPLLSDNVLKGSILISLNTMTLAAGVTVAAVMAVLNTAENPIPKFTTRASEVQLVSLSYSSQDHSTVMLENISNTAVKNLEDDYGRLQQKLAASIALKAAVSLASGIAAKKIAEKAGTSGLISGIVGLAVGAGTGAALFSTMKPDLRCWHTLPSNLQVARLSMQPGVHEIALSYLGKNGALIRRSPIKVNIVKGRKTIINERTLD